MADLGFTQEELNAACSQVGDNEAVNYSSQEEETQDIVSQHTQVADSAKNSLDFFAALAMPLIYKYTYPDIFISIWQWLTSYATKIRDFSQLALGLPRGFGKTALVKLFILWCILFTNKKFILVICGNEKKAINIISDIIDMLEERNIKSVFGDWKVGVETDQQLFKKFSFRGRTIILLGAGAGTDVRGVTVTNERPDVMVFDDIQTRECADSQVQSLALEQWMIGTAMKAKSPSGCLFIFIANMYPTKWSLLSRLQDNPNWIKFIVGGILEDGTSLWEELQPIAQLKREFQNDLSMGRPDIFYAEVLNDKNASSNNLIDLSNLPSVPYAPTDIAQGKFIVIDPSSGNEHSDNVAVGYCEVFDGYPVLREVTSDKLSPGETIRKALTYCLVHQCKLICVESVAYQSTLCYWFGFIMNQLGIQTIEILEIYPGRRSKNARILEMFKSYAKGELFVDPAIRPTVHLEITQFNPLKTNNTDNILDLLTYMPKILEIAGPSLLANSDLESQEWDKMEIVSESELSLF